MLCFFTVSEIVWQANALPLSHITLALKDGFTVGLFKEKGSQNILELIFPWKCLKAEPFVLLKVTLASQVTISTRVACVEFRLQDVRPKRGFLSKKWND